MEHDHFIQRTYKWPAYLISVLYPQLLTTTTHQPSPDSTFVPRNLHPRSINIFTLISHDPVPSEQLRGGNNNTNNHSPLTHIYQNRILGAPSRTRCSSFLLLAPSPTGGGGSAREGEVPLYFLLVKSHTGGTNSHNGRPTKTTSCVSSAATPSNRTALRIAGAHSLRARAELDSRSSG